MKSVETTKATNADDSFVIKCLLKTVRFMWQVTELPGKIGESLGTLYRYAQDSVDSILCIAGKARRKERDGDQNSTDTKLYLEESVLERKLPEADLKALVDLPAGLDYNEWLASHTLALFEHVNLVYGTISEFCTPTGCPDMTGPGNRTYLWFDEKGKKTRVAAPQYIDYVMTFTQKTVSDESIFPTKYANEFPSSFESIARKILRLQFHVIAHLYAAHFREIALLGLHTHLNLTFAHLTALHRRFNLIDEKETDVLRDLEVALRLTDDSQSDHTSAASANTVSTHDGTTAAGTQQQQHHCGNNATASVLGGGGGGGGASTHLDDVNLMASNASSITTAGTTTAGTTTAATTLIDGDAVAPPICTQPEAATKAAGGGVGMGVGGVGGVGGGGGGLIGGILGDLTTGEFGDTTRYCTSALPTSATGGGGGGGGGVGGAASLVNNCSVNCTATPANCNACAAAAATANDGTNCVSNNNNNTNNQHQNHNHHGHHHHHGYHHHNNHHHHHHHHHQYQHAHASPHHPNSGLIQCNASTAPSSINASAAAAAAAAAAATNNASNNTAATTADLTATAATTTA